MFSSIIFELWIHGKLPLILFLSRMSLQQLIPPSQLLILVQTLPAKLQSLKNYVGKLPSLLVKVLTICTTFFHIHTTISIWVHINGIKLPVASFKVEKKFKYAYIYKRPNFRSNFDIDFKPTCCNFYGTKIIQKNWPDFSLFYYWFSFFCLGTEFLPCFATSAPQFVELTIFCIF